GEIDAYVGNILVTSYYIGKLGYTHLKVVGETPYHYEQAMGVRKDWPIFVSILNKALSAIPESEKSSVYNRWVGVRYEHEFDYALLWMVLVAALVLFAIFSYWNRKLSNLNQQLVIARNQEKQARITVERANEQLKAVDQLKSMFIASMSHELRTPLNSIIGFSGLLMQGVSGTLNDKQGDSVRRINRAGTHLLNLISDVIDISKIEAGRIDAFLEKVLLKEVVDEAIETIRPLADAKGLELEVVANSWPEVTTDRKRLLQCLLNYLSNAVKYSEKGKVVLTIIVNGDGIELSVTDSGIGISEADQPKLFEAFERFDSHLRVKAGGTGLGLYLTRKITEGILQGRVSVESKINEGSTFRLMIPLHAKAEN
ncbi:MAG: ATP-binding protein, partial [Gammaproteobacteria bacterium]|nr:ATP-binding protein [Gammaproteobacteria bacterium]